MGNSISSTTSSSGVEMEEIEAIYSHHKRSAELIGMGTNETTNPPPELSLEAWLCQHWDPTINGTGHQVFNADDILNNEKENAGYASKVLNGSAGEQGQSGVNYCDRNYDGLLCWPETMEGNYATLQCFDNLNGIKYDSSKTVSRYCEPGGMWENVTDYAPCVPITTNATSETDEGLGITIHVYFFGYCLSLVALVFAMIILIAFKELRCLRNKIHTQLIITYILAAALWITTNFTTGSSSASSKGSSMSTQVSCVTFILLHYFHLTSFFWMFVEGLYLYVLVVKTFMADNIKLRVYTGIGWGLPLLIVIGWSIAKLFTQPVSVGSGIHVDVPGDGDVACLGVAENVYDWIYKGPVIFVLFANIIFLIRIMWVLITKLRSATSPETQQSRKAAKALVVLVPLLGITYVFTLVSPKFSWYEHVRALLLSTQGFLVALLYCFLNGEVRIALRHRWNRLNSFGPNEDEESNQCSRVLGKWFCCCCYCWFRKDGRRRNLHHVHDWSPRARSRTESIRLYTSTGNFTCGKRTSSLSSELTTTTSLYGGGPVGRNSISSNGKFSIFQQNVSRVPEVELIIPTFIPFKVKFTIDPTDSIGASINLLLFLKL